MTDMNLLNRLSGAASAYWEETRGAIAMKFALIALPLFMTAGLAIDGSRAYLLQYRFQAALDAAALATGSVNLLEYPEDATPSEKAAIDAQNDVKVDALAQSFVSRNFQLPGATVTSVNATIDGHEILVEGDFTSNTMMMALIDQNTFSVSADTEIDRAGGGLMVSLVLDNTGSMWGGNKIVHLRESTELLVQELFQDDTNPQDLRVGLVPYASAVNPGVESNSLIDPALGLTVDAVSPLGWKGCVVERTGTHSIGDTDTATGGYWKPFIYPAGDDNNFDWHDASTVIPGGVTNTNGITGPNIGCPTPITPLTNNRQTVFDAAAALTSWNRGGTLTDIGVAWGYRVLTPGAPFTQSNVTDPGADPLDPDPPTMWNSPRWTRAAVLMTDGDSMMWRLGGKDGPNKKLDGVKSDYTGYEREGEGVAYDIFGSSTSKNEVNDRIAALCETMKADNVVVYTVTFGSSPNNNTRNLYRDCASDPGKYWHANGQVELRSSFVQIGRDLASLRITR